MRHFIALALGLILGLGSGVFNAWAQAALPATPAFVMDMAAIFSFEEERALTAQLTQYESETRHELAILTVAALHNEPIAEYAVRAGNYLSVGKKVGDTGILMVIAPVEREVFIATGKGAEGLVTDVDAARIIDSIVLPEFREERYAAGTEKAMQAIMGLMAGEPLPASVQTHGEEEETLMGMMLFGFFVLTHIAAILGRSKAIWPGAALGGVLGGVAGLVFSFGLLGAMGAAASMAILGLLLDMLVSNAYTSAVQQKRSPPWWAGGSSGHTGRGSSGGFGGFGGGSFGGGGASGKW